MITDARVQAHKANLRNAIYACIGYLPGLCDADLIAAGYVHGGTAFEAARKLDNLRT